MLCDTSIHSLLHTCPCPCPCTCIHTCAHARTLQTHTQPISELLVVPDRTGSIPSQVSLAALGHNSLAALGHTSLASELCPLLKQSPCVHELQRAPCALQQPGGGQEWPKIPKTLEDTLLQVFHPLPQPPRLVLHRALSCSIQDFLPAVLTTARGQRALNWTGEKLSAAFLESSGVLLPLGAVLVCNPYQMHIPTISL